MKLKLIEAQNLCGWFDEFRTEKIKALPLRTQWDLLSNIKELQPEVTKFQYMRNNFVEGINKEYFGEEKSDAVEGSENSRKVKDEYIAEYKAKVEEVNKVILEASLEEKDYTFKPIDVESIIDSISPESGIELKDIEMMSVFGEVKADVT